MNRPKPKVEKPNTSVVPQSVPDLPAAKEKRESFIVQNVFEGPHCINDGKEGLSLTFDGFQIIDLTWEDSEKIYRSQGLRRSLEQGILRRVSIEEAAFMTKNKVERERKKLIKEQLEQKKKMAMVDLDSDTTMEAEVLDLNKAASKTHEEVSTSGYVNDPMSYAMAYANAEKEAKARGEYLDPVEFAEKMTNNPALFRDYTTGSRGTASGDPNRGRATVAIPSGTNYETQTGKVNMTNFNRDGAMAGSEINILPNYAETIDLGEEESFGEEVDN